MYARFVSNTNLTFFSHQIERDVIDLKDVTNEKSLIDVHFSHNVSESGGGDIAICGKVT